MDKMEPIERRVKLRDVRVLITVVQAGSMHKAAKRLRTSQSAVSRSIGDLEHALHVRLLDRTPRGIEPTRYGHAIIKRGVAAFDELRQGVKDIEFLADPTAGELRIGCSETMAAGPVLNVFNALRRRHPRIVFHIVNGAAPTLYRELAERNVELLLTRITRALPEDMTTEILFDDFVVVAAAVQNPWTRRRRLQLAELLHEPWTLPPSDNFSSALFIEVLRAQGLKPPQAMVITQSLNMRNRLLATGQFLTVLPGFSVRTPGNHPQLKALSVDLPNAGGNMGIITLRNRMLSPLAQVFVDRMRAIAKP
jgi:DNA-binding transcriptional LysR family regulator